MARFNQSVSDKATVNYEGGIAYKMSPELELYAAVCTASLQNKFYESKDESIERIRALIAAVDPVYAAKLAVYTREKMYLRSVPLVVAVELAKIHSGDSLVSKTVERVIQRADELTEILAYYQKARLAAEVSPKSLEGKKLNNLSKQVQKGVAKAFHKFDEYQFAKYNREGEVKLRDALFLCHATPLDEGEKKLFTKIADDKLEVPYTWETELSEAGKSGKDKKVVWEELIDSDKVGYMALLRNLRNILEAKVSHKHLVKVAKQLSDADAVKKSKQLPFRFLSAYREIPGEAEGATMVMDALEKAVVASAENIEGFDYDTRVLIACDVSGSMNSPISPRSKVENYDIGIILAMLLKNRCKDAITGVFGDVFKVEAMPSSGILANCDKADALANHVGWSTNGHKVVEYLTEKNIAIDKVMIFTDCQMWDSEWDGSHRFYGAERGLSKAWAEYKKIAPKAKLYLFDLSGYGHVPLKIQGDVNFVAGWSDKVFDVMSAIEKGGSAVKEINKIEL